MPPSVEPLGPADAEALKSLLLKDPIQNLYLLGIFEDFGVCPKPGVPRFAFFGRSTAGSLTGAVFVGGDGGLVIPAGSSFDVGKIAHSLMGRVKLRASFGEKACVDELVRHLAPNTPRLCRNQRLFSVSADDLGPFTNPTLRLAREDELLSVLPIASSALCEVLGTDPVAEDLEGFKARTLQKIRAKRTYVLEVDGKLVFKIDVGSRSEYGAELEGVYTVEGERRRGHATLSLGQISRHLLSSLPRLTLRVDEKDPSLAGVARKVGYIGGKSQKLVVVD